LDSLLKQPHGEHSGAPRIFKRLYLVPFNAISAAAPAVGVLSDFGDGSILRRYWRTAQIVDSAQVVGPDGHTLRPGGPLYILSPIDWLGPDAAHFQVAEYTDDLNSGAQLFLLLRRGQQGWIVTEISVGIQN